MANKRQLKKKISYACGDVAAEIILAAHFFDSVDPEKVNKIISDVATLQVEARGMVSVAFDKVPKDFKTTTKKEYNKERRAYYRTAYASLRKEFSDKLVAIVKEMNEALPEDVKKVFAGK